MKVKGRSWAARIRPLIAVLGVVAVAAVGVVVLPGSADAAPPETKCFVQSLGIKNTSGTKPTAVRFQNDISNPVNVRVPRRVLADGKKTGTKWDRSATGTSCIWFSTENLDLAVCVGTPTSPTSDTCDWTTTISFVNPLSGSPTAKIGDKTIAYSERQSRSIPTLIERAFVSFRVTRERNDAYDGNLGFASDPVSWTVEVTTAEPPRG